MIHDKDEIDKQLHDAETQLDVAKHYSIPYAKPSYLSRKKHELHDVQKKDKAAVDDDHHH